MDQINSALPSSLTGSYPQASPQQQPSQGITPVSGSRMVSPEPENTDQTPLRERNIETPQAMPAETLNSAFLETALKTDSHDKTFSLLKDVAENSSGPAYDRAIITMARMSLRRRSLGKRDDFKTYNPGQLIKDLLELTKKGDFEAKLLLKEASCHPSFAELFKQQEGQAVLDSAPDLPEWSGLPLGQRQRLMELYRHELSTKAKPSFVDVKCCENAKAGEEFTLLNIDGNRPVAELILALFCRRDIHLSSILVGGDEVLLKPYKLQPVDVSVAKLLEQTGIEYEDYFSDEVNEILQKALAKEDWTERTIEKQLTHLYHRLLISDLGEETKKAFEFSQMISDAHDRLKKKMDDGSTPREEFERRTPREEFECRALDALHKATACLDYCLSPVNKHVDHLIIKAIIELDAHRSEASKGQKSDERAEVEFCDEIIEVDTGLSGARCSFIPTAASFKKTAADFLKTGEGPINLSDLPDGPIAESFKTYLMTGKTDNVQQLNLQETCELMMFADLYQALELKSTCLLSLLKGIRFDVFDEKELKYIDQLSSTSPELQAALKPLKQQWLDDLIVRVANERDAHRSEASKGQKSNVQAEVEFSDGTIQMDTGLLNARCSYTAAAASFAGNMSKKIEAFDFTNIHDDQVKEQIKTYLMTGKTDGVQELDLQKTCDLLLHADYYQALELKSTCLLNLLKGVRSGELDDKQLEYIHKISPAFPELETALELL